MSHPGRRIGGSDIPKLLGISRYGDAADVYERVALGVEAEWNPAMERGAAEEPIMRAFGQRHLRLELEDRESDYHPHAGNDFAGAQVDDLAQFEGCPVVVEYKTQSCFSKGWGPEGSDEIPEQYRAQVAWQLACVDRDLAVVVAEFGQDTPRGWVASNIVTYQLQRDGVYESHLLSVAEDFWRRHVLPRVRPTTSGKPKAKKK